ncbi:acyl carrier protein [Defluviimonas salinarum]|uniref:Acyl carrier protein n=1 Tax=Defluviimonas salinarum TaxID=2992147 RepID=A0ABT3J9F2_9RHOB|nr:acyl carrier protein [Defluviimonas salinarum]MCW3784311.1 acyl carrier protein [Defluviimonas salinarum]
MPDADIRLREITAKLLNADPDRISPASRFVDDLGAGSLETVELVMAFEDAFGIEIPDDVIETLETVGAAASYIRLAGGRTSLAA